jgi:hypothetical protein
MYWCTLVLGWMVSIQKLPPVEVTSVKPYSVGLSRSLVYSDLNMSKHMFLCSVPQEQCVPRVVVKYGNV